MQLPNGDTSAFVEIDLLDGGSFTASTHVLLAKKPVTTFRMYAWCYHIYHPASQRHVIWDVGISSNPSEYTAYNVKHYISELDPVSPRISLPEQLKKRGISPNEVETVIFSHHHWDHSRPIKHLFPRATGYFGPGTFAHCAPGRFHDDEYHPDGKWDANFVHPEGRTENCAELEGRWVPFGPFNKALDFFGDGSFWVIEAPGHMAGNLVAAARLAKGDWVVLGGDCCHTRTLFDGQEAFATWKTPSGQIGSAHEDLDSARDSVQKLRVLEREGFHIALAHDSTWMLSATDEVLMSLLSDEMKDFAKNRLATEGLP